MKQARQPAIVRARASVHRRAPVYCEPPARALIPARVERFARRRGAPVKLGNAPVEALTIPRDAIRDIALRHRVTNVRVFGSGAARREIRTMATSTYWSNQPANDDDGHRATAGSRADAQVTAPCRTSSVSRAISRRERAAERTRRARVRDSSGLNIAWRLICLHHILFRSGQIRTVTVA